MAQKLISRASLDTVFVVLRLLCQDFPAVEADLEALIGRLERRFRYRGKTVDRRAIVRAIRAGYVTAKDISQCTRIPYVTATKRISELVADGILTVTHAQRAEGHGGDRCTKLFWLTGNWKEIFKAKYPKPVAGQTSQVL